MSVQENRTAGDGADPIVVIVYGDFNCLHCYLASQRADQLARAGKADVEWRAVEHRPWTDTSGPRGAGPQRPSAYPSALR
jgi:hypothetical protein